MSAVNAVPFSEHDPWSDISLKKEPETTFEAVSVSVKSQALHEIVFSLPTFYKNVLGRIE